MDIFKFGGASLQNTSTISKLPKIIATYTGNALVIVVSAMGKMTRTLEEVFQKYLHNQPFNSAIEEVYNFHIDIVKYLLPENFAAIQADLFIWKQQLLEDLAIPCLAEEVEKKYSSIVAWGEILSSKIIYQYLLQQGIYCIWLDARDYIKTTGGFINAQLESNLTKDLIEKDLLPILKSNKFVLTQGFIGKNLSGQTTTLGKEGSDFTGAILAAGLGADSLTIWKDVPGIMSGDPKVFKHAISFSHISYETIATMAFYGAQIVHPKTIYPLAIQRIPLHIRPFYDTASTGTTVSNKELLKIETPIYILRKDQFFIKISLGEYLFIEEKHIGEIFHILDELSLHLNLFQKTPYYISICLNNDCIKSEKLSRKLANIFELEIYRSVQILTIISGSDSNFLEFIGDKIILAKQYYDSFYQIVFLDKEQDLSMH